MRRAVFTVTCIKDEVYAFTGWVSFQRNKRVQAFSPFSLSPVVSWRLKWTGTSGHDICNGVHQEGLGHKGGKNLVAMTRFWLAWFGAPVRCHPRTPDIARSNLEEIQFCDPSSGNSTLTRYTLFLKFSLWKGDSDCTKHSFINYVLWSTALKWFVL